jgi:hypothetical protein
MATFALLLASCGGKAAHHHEGRAVAGSLGVDEAGVAGLGGQREVVAASDGVDASTAGTGGNAGAPAESGAGTAGASPAACVSKTIESQARRVAFEFVVEASESMKEPALGSTLSRWQVVKEALAGFVRWLPQRVLLGLVVVPADGQCSTASVEVPLAPTTPEHAERLVAALEGVEPGGGEPVDDAVHVAVDDLEAGASSTGARPALVLVLDDMPSSTAGCRGGGELNDALVLELRNALNADAMLGVLIFGLTGDDEARQSLVSLSDAIDYAWFFDCGLAMPQPYDDGPGAAVTLQARFERLLYDVNPPDVSCTVNVPELLEHPSVDLSRMTLSLTENGVRTESLDVPRDQECESGKAGWRLEERGDAITLCGSLCSDIYYKIQDEDLTTEFAFYCR